jgi:hypothetical protein
VLDFSVWTSLGLKFVVQIAQLIDRAFAVSVAGANVKAREITTGESSGYSIKKENREAILFFVDQPGLEICCVNCTTHRQSVCCQRCWCKR